MKINKSLLVFVVFLLILSFISGFISCLILSDNYSNGKVNVHRITIKDSYSIWSPKIMKLLIQEKTINKYNSSSATYLLNRDYKSMYIEWWLHNLGYYITKPFCFNEKIYKINLRCKDVDLEELT